TLSSRSRDHRDLPSFPTRRSSDLGPAVCTPAEMSKSCVPIGGKKAAMDFKGAPHIPGIIYTTKEKTSMARVVRVTDRYSKGLSCAKRIFPRRYRPINPKITIHNARNTSLSRNCQL